MFSYIATCLQLRLTINQNKIGLSLPFMNNFRCSKIILWLLRSWSHIAYVKYRMYIKNVYCFRHFRPFQRKKWEGHSYNYIAILIETGYSLVQKKYRENLKSCHCKIVLKLWSPPGAKTDAVLFRNPPYFIMFPKMTLY